MTHNVILNPSKKPFFLREFGGIKIHAGKTMDPKSYKISETILKNALLAGPLKDALDKKELIMIAKPKPVPPYVTILGEAKICDRRKKLIGVKEQVDEVDFIEQLQAEFSGNQLANMTDTQIAKSTEKLITNTEFDGCQDPLAE